MSGFEAGNGMTSVARSGRGVVGFEWDNEESPAQWRKQTFPKEEFIMHTQ